MPVVFYGVDDLYGFPDFKESYDFPKIMKIPELSCKAWSVDLPCFSWWSKILRIHPILPTCQCWLHPNILVLDLNVYAMSRQGKHFMIPRANASMYSGVRGTYIWFWWRLWSFMICMIFPKSVKIPMLSCKAWSFDLRYLS